MELLRKLMPDLMENTQAKLGQFGIDFRDSGMGRGMTQQEYQDLSRKTSAGDLEIRVKQLEEENGVLSLLFLAILRRLCETTDTCIEDITGILGEIDMLDGRADGRVDVKEIKQAFGIADPEPAGAGIHTCKKCKRGMSQATGKCIYCGWKRGTDPDAHQSQV